MIELKLDENNELEFEVDVKSDTSNNIQTQVRLVLENGNINMLFMAEKKNENTYSVNVPELSKLLNSNKKEINCMLEVIANDRYFVPFKDNVKLLEGTKVEAKPKQQVIKEVKKADVSIKVNAAVSNTSAVKQKENKYNLYTVLYEAKNNKKYKTIMKVNESANIEAMVDKFVIDKKVKNIEKVELANEEDSKMFKNRSNK